MNANEKSGHPSNPHTNGECGISDAHSDEDHVKVGQTIWFKDITTERRAIVRGFQWADWSESSLIMVDINPPLPGSPVLSTRRIEWHQVTRKV